MAHDRAGTVLDRVDEVGAMPPSVPAGASRGSGIIVRTLGEFEVTIDGRPVTRWRAGKSRQLLQYLLVHRGRPVPKAMLYEALWPDADWSANTSSLKVAVHTLRSIIGAPGEAAGVPSPALRLTTEPCGYMLEATGAHIDFEAFDDLVDGAHALVSRGDREGAYVRFRCAVDLYAGDFLPGVYLHWAEERRQWLRSRALCALEYLVEADMGAGDRLAVIRSCRRMLEIDPFHERSYRILMLVHGQLGQLGQVRRWYQLCTARLRQLHVAPHESTRRLYASALRGDLVARPLLAAPRG